jgi:ribonuclease P protein component
MRQRYTLAKAEKLKSRKRIEWVFKEGKSLSVFPFKVFYLLAPPPAETTQPIAATSSASHPNAPVSTVPLPHQAPSLPTPAPLQAGFGAGSRHFKKAVDRNRIKRLSREAYRLQKQPLMDALAEKERSMALFFIYTGKELPDHGTVKAKIGVLLQKLIKEVK